MNSYCVESILSDKIRGGKTLYEVKWAHTLETTFEPIENLFDCNDALQFYLKKKNAHKVSTQK